MNFAKTALAVLLGAALSTDSVAQLNGGLPKDAGAKKTFKENISDTSIKINPAYRKQLESVIPFDDTTRNFYPSTRQTNIDYSTPREEFESFGIHNERVADHVALVRESVTARSYPLNQDGRPEGEDKIIALHVKQSYERKKTGEVWVGTEKENDEVKFFINTKTGVRIVTLTNDDAKVENYELAAKDHAKFIKKIADGKLDAQEYLSDNDIKPTRTQDITLKGSVEGPLGRIFDNDGGAVRSIKNDHAKTLPHLFQFKK